jgi:hypothetical protein
MALLALGISISSYDCNNRFYFAMFDCFIKAIASSFHKPTIAPQKNKPNSDRLSNPHKQRSPLKKTNQTAIA